MNCKCSRAAPCLFHYARDTDDDRLAWRQALGIRTIADPKPRRPMLHDDPLTEIYDRRGRL